MRSKLAPQESHWRELFERYDEDDAAAKLDEQIETQSRAVRLAGAVLTLRNMPGYSDFEKALKGMQDYSLRLLTATQEGNDVMRVLQGQVQAYGNMLAVMENGQARVKALEQGLQELQDQKAVAVRPDRNHKTTP